MKDFIEISEKIEFDWDESNIKKNEIKHKVFFKECEQAFLINPFITRDLKHSKNEKRYHCIGITELGEILFISFTMRNLKVRIISARSADRKEKEIYEKAKKTSII